MAALLLGQEENEGFCSGATTAALAAVAFGRLISPSAISPVTFWCHRLFMDLDGRPAAFVNRGGAEPLHDTLTGKEDRRQRWRQSTGKDGTERTIIRIHKLPLYIPAAAS